MILSERATLGGHHFCAPNILGLPLPFALLKSAILLPEGIVGFDQDCDEGVEEQRAQVGLQTHRHHVK